MSEPEKIVVEESAPVVEPAKAPTREDLRAQGWSAKEMDAAEKRGMLSQPKDAPNTPPEAAKPVVEETQKKEESAKEPVKPRGVLPDFTMNAEQERVFMETFGPGTAPRAMYFRMKNERQSRQAAEARIRELEATLEAAKQSKAEPVPVINEKGELVDPEDQPLTLKAWKDLQKQEAEAYRKEQEAVSARNNAILAAQKAQDDFARATYKDFDPTLELAKDLMMNLETLVPDRWKQERVVKMVRDLQIAAAQADRLGLDEYNASHIAYELGTLHPNYGRTAPEKGEETGLKDPKPTGGAKTPEEMKRIEANALRRSPSAVVADRGGRRTISPSEMDSATLNKLPPAERLRFKEKYPDLYAKILRG